MSYLCGIYEYEVICFNFCFSEDTKRFPNIDVYNNEYEASNKQDKFSRSPEAYRILLKSLVLEQNFFFFVNQNSAKGFFLLIKT